jgi:hypothetical protein
MADEREQENQAGPQIEPEQDNSVREREARQRREAVAQQIAHNKRMMTERALDETLADSFPASDPPSSIPNPGEEDAA